MEKGLKVWLNGNIVNSEDAKINLLTHSVQYGSGIFEGIRAYQTQKGTAIFRLKDHVKRLENSARMHSMHLEYSRSEIESAIINTIKVNRLTECYIRPFAFYDDQNIGLSAVGKRVSLFIATLPFGAYFGKGEEKGIRCKISSWKRINSSMLPVEAKASGNYINSIIANTEARTSGFDEAILLSGDGYIAEGPGENIFLVDNNSLVTPDKSSDILMGITRDSIIKIAENMGIEVTERKVHREEIYACQEAFFTGTAAELTPINVVDGIKIGSGKPGPITKMLSERYSLASRGKLKEFESWLTYLK